MVLDIDYETWLRSNSSSEKAADYRMSNVWFLIEALKSTLERDEDGEMTIEQAIGKLVLRDMLERQQEEQAYHELQKIGDKKKQEYYTSVMNNLEESMQIMVIL